MEFGEGIARDQSDLPHLSLLESTFSNAYVGASSCQNDHSVTCVENNKSYLYKKFVVTKFSP